MTSVVVGTEGGAALKCNLAPATKVTCEKMADRSRTRRRWGYFEESALPTVDNGHI